MPRKKYYKKRSLNQNESIVLAVVVLLGVIPSALKSASSYLPWFIFASFMLVAVVIAVIVTKERLRTARARALRLEHIDTMPGIEFERYVGELLSHQGYRASYTPINDYGIDIVAAKDGIRVGVQVKRYQGRIDQKAIREAVAGLAKHKCAIAMVVTNSLFSSSAIELAKVNNCILVDRDALADWIIDFSRG